MYVCICLEKHTQGTSEDQLFGEGCSRLKQSQRQSVQRWVRKARDVTQQQSILACMRAWVCAPTLERGTNNPICEKWEASFNCVAVPHLFCPFSRWQTFCVVSTLGLSGIIQHKHMFWSLWLSLQERMCWHVKTLFYSLRNSQAVFQSSYSLLDAYQQRMIIQISPHPTTAYL